MSPNGKMLACGGEDKIVKLWDIETWKEFSNKTQKEEEIGSVLILLHFTSDGECLISGD